jgi:hypothetical protein
MNIVDKNTEIEIKDPYLRRAIYNAFDGKCFYTGRDVSFKDMEIDHILPKSKGGTNCISNYVLSCNYINNKKKANIYESLIKVSTEVVDSMFSENVVNCYNQLKMNDYVLMEHVEINDFVSMKLKEHNFRKYRFTGMIRQSLTPVKIYPLTQLGKIGKKPKLYYNTKELEHKFSSWITTQ